MVGERWDSTSCLQQTACHRTPSAGHRPLKMHQPAAAVSPAQNSCSRQGDTGEADLLLRPMQFCG